LLLKTDDGNNKDKDRIPDDLYLGERIFIDCEIIDHIALKYNFLAYYIKKAFN